MMLRKVEKIVQKSFESVAKPLQNGSQKGPHRLQKLAGPSPIFGFGGQDAPRGLQEASRRPPRGLPGPPRQPKKAPEGPQDPPKTVQEGPQDAPKTPQDALRPRRKQYFSKEAPRKAQEGPQDPQDGPKPRRNQYFFTVQDAWLAR